MSDWIHLFQNVHVVRILFTRYMKGENNTSEVEIIWGFISWNIFLFLMAIHFPMYDCDYTNICVISHTKVPFEYWLDQQKVETMYLRW